MPEQGWFTLVEFGAEASDASFHIVQPSDLTLRKQMLPRLEPLAMTGEIRGVYFAALFDRVAVGEGRPQRYGTSIAAKKESRSATRSKASRRLKSCAGP